jgi:hypothetical protein
MEPTTSGEQTPPDMGDAIGGEIRVGRGVAPRWLRWWGYFLHVWAVIYILVHPSVGRREIILVAAVLIAAWLVFYALTKRPSEP